MQIRKSAHIVESWPRFIDETVARAATDVTELAAEIYDLFRGEIDVETGARASSRVGATWIGASVAACEQLEIAVVKAAAERTVPGTHCTASSTLLVLDLRTTTFVTVIAGESLTAARTAASVLAASRLLGRGTPRTAALLGTGVQARWQLSALLGLRSIQRILVAGRSTEKARSFVETAGAAGDTRVHITPSFREAVKGAELVITATSSKAPLLRAKWLSPGTHVAAIGAHDEGGTEIDEDIAAQAAVVLVDTADALRSGDLTGAIAKGRLSPDRVKTPQAFCRAPLAAGSDELTLWKSVGAADQDLVAAWHLLRRCGFRVGQTGSNR